MHDACYVLEEDVSYLKQLLNCSGLDERFGLLVDIHINELQLVVHNCDAKVLNFQWAAHLPPFSDHTGNNRQHHHMSSASNVRSNIEHLWFCRFSPCCQFLFIYIYMCVCVGITWEHLKTARNKSEPWRLRGFEWSVPSDARRTTPSRGREDLSWVGR